METELEETEALKEKRDARAEKESKLQSELSSIKKTYYCDVCDKTYNSGAELEVHLSSYDHGHKKRFRDMKMMQVSRWWKEERAYTNRTTMVMAVDVSESFVVLHCSSFFFWLICFSSSSLSYMYCQQSRTSKASSAARERKEAERQRREMEKYAGKPMSR